MSKRIFTIGVPFLTLVVGLALSIPSSFAKPAYAKKEGKGCAFCHVAAGKKELNEVGKCYAEHEHSLDTCAPKP